ncbi:MAG: ABC transporter ATP-binding protein [Acidimicrobiales bacterium]
MTGAVVAAEGVIKDWGSTRALDGATFTMGKGVTGLLGSNGAGKTTMLGLILGMHNPDGGQLAVLGSDPRFHGPAIRARIGYAPEHDAMPPDLRAHDLVRHIAELHGLPTREAQARASDALYEVGLGEERLRAVGTMSTGQRQRVKLALAIAHDPDLVLLDEPTNGLDPMQRDQMLGLIKQVATRLGHDVILSSHLLDEVERVADAAVIIDQGRVVRAGSLTELRGVDRSELLVELDVDATDTASMLQEAGLAAIADGRMLTVALESPNVFDVVRDTIARAEVPLRRMRTRTATLEEVFLAGSASGTEPVATDGAPQ